MVTDVGTIKIELPVGLVSDLAGQRHDRRDFPIDSRAGSHFAISDHGVIESRVTRVVAEVIVYAVIVLLQIPPRIKRYVTVHLELQTGSR